jgi:gluconolactonase
LRVQWIVLPLALALTAEAQGAATEQIVIDPAELKTLATGLRGTEGPSVLPDGSVAVLEPMGGTVLRVSTDGTRSVLTTTGMGVAGTALGHDNALYVTKINIGAILERLRAGAPRAGARGADGPPAGGRGGNNPPWTASPAAILRIDLTTLAVKTLYTEYQGKLLQEPNDLVVDEWGDLWFTDTGSGSVYSARADGSGLQRSIADAQGVNGIALSPDRRTLYIVANGKLLGYGIVARGKLEQKNGHAVARVLATLDPKIGAPDGMKTEANGDILIACTDDGILRYSSRGTLISQIRIPGVAIVNLAFGGKDGRTLYLSDRATNDQSGRLQSMNWPRPGATFP